MCFLRMCALCVLLYNWLCLLLPAQFTGDLNFYWIYAVDLKEWRLGWIVWYEWGHPTNVIVSQQNLPPCCINAGLLNLESMEPNWRKKCSFLHLLYKEFAFGWNRFYTHISSINRKLLKICFCPSCSFHRSWIETYFEAICQCLCLHSCCCYSITWSN